MKISSQYASLLPRIALLGISLLAGSGSHCLAQPGAPPSANSNPARRNCAESGWLNARVLAVVEQMPVGGGYAVDHEASKSLRSAVNQEDAGLNVRPEVAKPSFCSGAVYLVLLSALKPEVDGIRDTEKRRAMVRILNVANQPDGIGVWGRWNSNGPCMAITFAESGMGVSYWGYESAVPGDFLKLWWTDAIGRDESGHSVIFLGLAKAENGEAGIQIWSSNKPGGYGKKVIPLTKIKHALVSRCDHPDRVTGLLQLDGRNNYLASMLKRNTTRDEIDRRISGN